MVRLVTQAQRASEEIQPILAQLGLPAKLVLPVLQVQRVTGEKRPILAQPALKAIRAKMAKLVLLALKVLRV